MEIVKPMNPGYLMRKSSIFAEIYNMVYYIDAVVIDRMLKLLDTKDPESDELNRIYHPVVDEFGGRSFEEIVVKVQSKQMVNPLSMYCDTKARSDIMRGKGKSFDLMQSYGYDWINYYAILELSSQLGKSPFLITSIGGGLKMIIKDKNLETLYLYAPIITEELNDEINKSFREANDVVLLDGPLPEALRKTKRCSSYFLQEIDSINYIPDGDMRSEILVPGYSYNQWFGKYGKTTSKECIQYCNEHHLDLNLVTIPL